MVGSQCDYTLGLFHKLIWVPKGLTCSTNELVVPKACRRSQTEARKPGLQYHMGLDARNPDFVACEQQRRRPACASTQSDQCLYYSQLEQ